jgi:hypothetical protein
MTEFDFHPRTRAIFAPGALAQLGDVARQLGLPAAKADSATEDCSKQVWPNFSPSCLRNADRAINVRLVTTNRR